MHKETFSGNMLSLVWPFPHKSLIKSTWSLMLLTGRSWNHQAMGWTYCLKQRNVEFLLLEKLLSISSLKINFERLLNRRGILVLGLIFGEITKSCRWSSAESSYSPMISFTTYHFPCSKNNSEPGESILHFKSQSTSQVNIEDQTK